MSGKRTGARKGDAERSETNGHGAIGVGPRRAKADEIARAEARREQIVDAYYGGSGRTPGQIGLLLHLPTAAIEHVLLGDAARPKPAAAPSPPEPDAPEVVYGPFRSPPPFRATRPSDAVYALMVEFGIKEPNARGMARRFVSKGAKDYAALERIMREFACPPYIITSVVNGYRDLIGDPAVPAQPSISERLDRIRGAPSSILDDLEREKLEVDVDEARISLDERRLALAERRRAGGPGGSANEAGYETSPLTGAECARVREALASIHDLREFLRIFRLDPLDR